MQNSDVTELKRDNQLFIINNYVATRVRHWIKLVNLLFFTGFLGLFSCWNDALGC